MQTFQGYRRAQGLPGVRNTVAVIPSVFCANTVARRIAEHVAGAIAFCHPVGCSQVGLDLELTARGLKGLGAHPNFYGAVVVGLGCERLRPRELAEGIAAAGKPVEMLVIQEEGDTLRAIEKGVILASRMVEEASLSASGGLSPLRTLARIEVRRDGRHLGARRQSRRWDGSPTGWSRPAAGRSSPR